MIKVFIINNLCLYEKPLKYMNDSNVILYKDPVLYTLYNYNKIRIEYLSKCIEYYREYLI